MDYDGEFWVCIFILAFPIVFAVMAYIRTGGKEPVRKKDKYKDSSDYADYLEFLEFKKFKEHKDKNE